MNNFEFNPDDKQFYTDIRQRAEAPRGGLTGLLMRLFKTDNENKVNLIMLVLALVFFAVSIIILLTFL